MLLFFTFLLTFFCYAIPDWVESFMKKKEAPALAKEEKTSANKVVETSSLPPKEIEEPSEIKEKEKDIQNLKEEVIKLKAESEKLNNPSTYAKYSKAQRQIIAMEKKIEAGEKELADLREKHKAEQKPETEEKAEVTQPLPQEQPQPKIENSVPGWIKYLKVLKIVRIMYNLSNF